MSHTGDVTGTSGERTGRRIRMGGRGPVPYVDLRLCQSSESLRLALLRHIIWGGASEHA